MTFRVDTEAFVLRSCDCHAMVSGVQHTEFELCKRFPNDWKKLYAVAYTRHSDDSPGVWFMRRFFDLSDDEQAEGQQLVKAGIALLPLLENAQTEGANA